jgi:hypothetical protein
MQSGEALRPVFIPRQQIKPPGLLMRFIGAQETGGRQLKEGAPAKKPVPFPQLCTIARR